MWAAKKRNQQELLQLGDTEGIARAEASFGSVGLQFFPPLGAGAAARERAGRAQSGSSSAPAKGEPTAGFVRRRVDKALAGEVAVVSIETMALVGMFVALLWVSFWKH